MAKIKITEQQYNKLLLHEEKKHLNENTNNVLLVIASLAGVDLTGNNKLVADKSKQDPNIMAKVKSTLETDYKLDNLVDALKEKGLKNPDIFLARNAEKIIKNYNDVSDDKLDFLAKTTLNELNPKK
jgi:hypothetical protein